MAECEEEISGRVIHICSFDNTEDLRGKALTYDSLKKRVLEVGRFSVFEATSTQLRARLFTRLCDDPDLETFRDPPGFPWTGIRRKQP